MRNLKNIYSRGHFHKLIFYSIIEKIFKQDISNKNFDAVLKNGYFHK